MPRLSVDRPHRSSLWRRLRPQATALALLTLAALALGGILAPEAGAQTQVWSGDVTAGAFRVDTAGYGYLAADHPLTDSGGTLSDDEFDIDGTTYTVWRIAIDSSGYTPRFTVATGSTPAVVDLPDKSELTLRLTYDGEVGDYALSDATYTDSSDIFAQGYHWSTSHPAGFLGEGDTMTVELLRTTPNTPPTGADKTVPMAADTTYAFTADDFGFLDADMDDVLASVKIVTLPTAGRLALDGTAVMANDVVTKAQLDDRDLTFTPVAGASGDPYTSFTFTVNDGTDDSAGAYTMTIDVTPTPDTAGALVSNFNQGDDTNHSDTRDRAQRFTTGSNTAGYTLTSVELKSEDGESDDATVSICTVDGSDHPTSSCTALTPPAGFAAGTLVFSAQSEHSLLAGTTYTLVIASPGGENLRLDATRSDDEDIGAGTGWSIADAFELKSGSTWGTTGTGKSLRIAVKGSAKPAAVACAMPSFGDRRDFWTGTVTVAPIPLAGNPNAAHGFITSVSASRLAPTEFSIGANDYTVDAAYVGRAGSTVGDVIFSLTSSLTSAVEDALKLHVCGDDYDFADATLDSSSHTYTFAADLDWSMESSRTLYLSLPANTPATGAPMITGTAEVGVELLVDVATVEDADGIAATTSSYEWFRIDGATETAIPGTRGRLFNRYTVSEDDVGKQLRVKLTFTDELGNEETLTSAAYPSGATVTSGPAITIAADRAKATGKMDWVHYTLTRAGDLAAELTVTVTFEGSAGNDWGLDPNVHASRDVTFAAASATAEQSIWLHSTGFGNIGFSQSATMGGTLTARLGAKTGYDTSDTDAVAVVVTSGPAWVIKLSDDAYSFTEGGGDQTIVVVATAASADMPAPSLNTLDDSVLGVTLITEAVTAKSPADYATISRAYYFPPSTCSADASAGNVQVCRTNVTFTPANDTETEPDETLTLVLQRTGGASSAIHYQGPGPDRTVSTTTKTYPATIVDDEFGVTGVAVTSMPQQATDTYGAWEHIELSVTFNRPVTVTGAPTYTFNLGGSMKTAVYEEGSGTSTLVFSYQVMPGDTDSDGIAWAVDALGGTLVEMGGTEVPVLTIALQGALSDHKVDGSQTASGAATVTVAVTSTPRVTRMGETTPDTYGLGETIEFTATFSEAVTVTGAPQLQFSMNNPGAASNPVRADYVSGSGTTTLVFGYTVQSTDEDTNGIWVGNQTIKLGSGDRIITDSNNVPANLANPALGTQSGHRVDGGRSADSDPPELLATPDGAVVYTGTTTLTLTWNEPLDEGSVPDPSAFSVSLGGGTGAPPSAVAVSGATVTLTLATPAPEGQTVTVSYTVPTGTGAMPLQDPIGNDAGTLTPRVATSKTLSVSGVAVTSAPAAGETYVAGEAIELTVTFSDPMTVTNTPTFAFTLGATARQATYARGTDSAELVFSYTVQSGDLDRDGISWNANALALAGGTIRLTTTDPNIVVDAALGHPGEEAQAPHRVDAVAPSMVSATVQATTLALLYDEALDGDSEPAPGAYTVTVSTGTAPTVTAVSVAGDTVTLTLSVAPAEGATVAVSYTVPTGTDPMPVRDAAGNAAGALTNESVTVGTPLRLVGGTGDHEGRLEIRHLSQWRAVCDDYWTDVEAGVVCRLLDFELGAVDNMGRTRDARGRSLPPSFGPAPGGKFWLDNVNCVGDETSLLDCPRRANLAVGVHNCRAKEAVGVQCRIEPQVMSFEVSPTSGPYTGGTTLRVTVRWDQAVVVKTPAGARAPKLVVGYLTGGVTSERDAVYASGTGTEALVFEHTLAGTETFASVSVVSDAVQLRDGGAIVWKTDQGVDASLALAPVANHQREAPVVVAAPVVEGTPAVGEAGDDGEWTAGETVEVRLTFSAPVAVDTTSGTPSIDLRLGAQARSAAYASGTGTAELVFGYTLAEGEGPHGTVLVTPDSLALNGGAIVSAADGSVAADLAHNGAAKAALPPPPDDENGPGTRDVDADGDGPTASFSDLPATHDGETPFTVKLTFDEAPELGYVTVRDALLDIDCPAGGTCAKITKASRVTGGSNLAWNLKVEPKQGYAITLTLPVRACGKTNAVCVDGEPLASEASATIKGEPLTATLTHLPGEDGVQDEHDGSSTFKMRLAFSMEPEVSYLTVLETMFDVTGGAIEKANRVTSPHDRHFDLTVKPNGADAVTFGLASPLPACGHERSVCTAPGRMIEGAVEATIHGPAAISVADAAVEEGPDAVLAFAVTLDRARSAPVTVDYATSNAEATAGSDYVETSGTLGFAANETTKTISVQVLDDGHDEGTETMRLTLSNAAGARIADGTAIGTIENTDPMPNAWMVRFGRTVGSQVVDALGQRLEGSQASRVTVAGVPLTGGAAPVPEDEADDAFGLPEWAKSAQREEEARTITADDLLLRSEFHLSSGSRAEGGHAFTTWGRVATGGFEAQVDGVTMDGEVTTGLLGFDAEWENLLAGVMLSRSAGEGAYRLVPAQGGDAGTVKSDLTGVYPYARIGLDAQVSAWALAGVGSGSITLTQAGRDAMKADLSMRMGALGVKGQVLDGTGPSGVRVNLKSDAMWVGTKNARSADMVGTEGDVTRLRLVAQGERGFVLAGQGTLTPSAELGLRHDGGDAETGVGVELGAGLRYMVGSFSIEGQARTLVAHQASGYEEWGASASVRLEPGATGRGLSLSIAPAWGRTGSASEQLWSARDAGELEGGGGFEADGRIEAQVGYGFALPHDRGLLTPYGALILGSEGARTMRGGARWLLAPDLAVTLDATRRESAGAGAESEVRVRAALRF